MVEVKIIGAGPDSEGSYAGDEASSASTGDGSAVEDWYSSRVGDYGSLDSSWGGAY